MQLRFLLARHPPAATNVISISAANTEKKGTKRDKLSKQTIFNSAKIKKFAMRCEEQRQRENKALHSFYRARCCRQSLGRIHRIRRHIRHRRRQCLRHTNRLLECLRAEVNHKAEHDPIQHNHRRWTRCHCNSLNVCNHFETTFLFTINKEAHTHTQTLSDKQLIWSKFFNAINFSVRDKKKLCFNGCQKSNNDNIISDKTAYHRQC